MKVIVRAAALALALAGGASSPATGEPALAPKCVGVFDGMYYTGKPASRALGLDPIRVQVALHWWPDRKHLRDLPPTSEIRRWLTRTPQLDVPLVIDLEHWPQRGTGASIAASVRDHITLLSAVRRLGYRGPIGYYGIPPVRDYWRAIQPKDSPAHQQWLRENEQWAAVAAAADVIFPSLYTFYDDPAGWERYALANLAAARRLAPAKPVWAFMWPQFHNSNKRLAFRYLAPQAWERQLEVVASAADGIVIWGGADVDGKGTGAWDANSPWWRATVAFLENNRSRCEPAQR